MENKKTFLIINQTSGSPYHGMVYRNYYLAREWVKEGHRAIIISSSYFHNFNRHPVTKGLFTFEEIDGIEYWWVKMPKYSQSRSVGRLFSIFYFPILLFFFPLWKLPRADVVILSGPPHLSIINSWLWAKLWRSLLIFEVRDIWPLTIVKLGNISPYNPVILILAFFEKLSYFLADMVVSVLSKSKNYFISRGMNPRKFHYVPNGVDIHAENFFEGEVSRKIREISFSKKIVIYTGSFGIANNLNQLIEAANNLKDRFDIHFIFVGEGPFKKEMLEKSYRLSNITIFDPVPKKEIPSILKYASIAYIGLIKSDLFKHGISPNKLFDYMAAKKPVVMAIDTEDDIVGKADCGLKVASCLPEDISKAITKLLDLPDEELTRLGENGRSFLEKNHSYHVLAKKYCHIVDAAISQK